MLSSAQPFSCVCLFVNTWTVVHQAPLSMEFPRQEYWSGLSFPPPGDLPDPGIELISPGSPALAGKFFTAEALGKPFFLELTPKPTLLPDVLHIAKSSGQFCFLP